MIPMRMWFYDMEGNIVADVPLGPAPTLANDDSITITWNVEGYFHLNRPVDAQTSRHP